MKLVLLKVLFLLVSTSVIAATDKPQGISSLIIPAINLTLLLVILVWKAKKPISDFFTNKAKEISELRDSAKNKMERAKERYEQLNEKVRTIDEEINNILRQSEQELSELKKQQEKELKQAKKNILEEENAKLKYDERIAYKELSRFVTESIANKVLNVVKKDESKLIKVERKIIDSITL